MENVVLERPAPDRQGVALKAFTRIADAWSLTLREAAALADMSESTWKRAKKPDFAGDLTRDQMLRLSALIQKIGMNGAAGSRAHLSKPFIRFRLKM